jgi:hypothetical protein
MAKEREFRETVFHQEKFILSPIQPSAKNPRNTISPTQEELALSGVCINTPDNCGFLINNQLYKSTTAVCKALLVRNGRTNEWAGPSHLFIYRDGTWRSYASLRKNTK